MLECTKTFQASSQEERPSMRRFLHWEGTKARVVASWGSTVRVKLFWEEAKEGCGYMLSERSSVKSMYSRLDIFEQSSWQSKVVFIGLVGNNLLSGTLGSLWKTGH